MTIIITHNGFAHRDDFLSCCLLMAHDPTISTISRREPTQAEIGSSDIYVLDVGGQYDEELKNFDHHQLEGAKCTIDLLNQAFDFGLEESKWLDFSNKLDCLGPKAAYGCDPDAAWISPIERTLLDMFSEIDVMTQESALWNVMAEIGKITLEDAREYTTYLETFNYTVKPSKWGNVCIVADIEVAQSKYFGRMKDRINETVIVSPHFDRDTKFCTGGWTLYSKAIETVNFRGLKNCLFVHKNGFLAHTNPMTLREVLDE